MVIKTIYPLTFPISSIMLRLSICASLQSYQNQFERLWRASEFACSSAVCVMFYSHLSPVVVGLSSFYGRQAIHVWEDRKRTWAIGGRHSGFCSYHYLVALLRLDLFFFCSPAAFIPMLCGHVEVFWASADVCWLLLYCTYFFLFPEYSSFLHRGSAYFLPFPGYLLLSSPGDGGLHVPTRVLILLLRFF